jgi:TP901 family phage tail tape measure protein
MALTDAYNVLLNIGNVPTNAAILASIFAKMKADFKEVTSVMPTFNEKGELVSATIKGIGNSAEATTKKLNATAAGLKEVSTASSTTAAAFKRADDAAKAFIDKKAQVALKNAPTASTDEKAEYNKRLAALREFLATSTSAQRQAGLIWSQLVKGNTVRHVGELRTAQLAIAKVIEAERQLGKAAADAAKKQADAAALTRQNLRYNAEAAKAIANITAAAKPLAPGVTASRGELLNLTKAKAALEVFVRDNKYSADRVKKIFEDLTNGIVTQYSGKLATLQQKIAAVTKATDALGQSTLKASRASEGMLLSWQSIFRFFQARVLYNAVGDITQAIKASTREAIEFQQVIARITTLAPDTVGGIANGFDEWDASIKRVAKTYNIDATDAAKSYYSALSNQIGDSVSQIENFTRVTAEFARTTGATAEQSNNLFSSAINAFKLNASDATKLAGNFFKAIDLGRITAAGLSGSFGRVAVAANTVGVSVQETLAALSTLSRQGVTDADAMTQVLNIMNKLIKPTDELKGLISEWGYESAQAAIANEGFTGVLKRLDQELQTGGAKRLGELINDIRGLRGTFGLTGQGLKEFQRDLAAITQSQDDYNRAVQKTEENIGFRLAKQLNDVKVTFLALGETAIKTFTPIIENLGGLVSLLKFAASGILTTFSALYAYKTLIPVFVGAYDAVRNFRAGLALATTAGTRLAQVTTVLKSAMGGIIGIAVGLLASYVLFSESAAERGEKAFLKAQESLARAAEYTKAALERTFGDLKSRTESAFKPILTGYADLRSRITKELDGIGKAADKTKIKLAQVESSVYAGIDTMLGRVRDNISKLNGISNTLETRLKNAFKKENIELFRDSLEDLSSGKQADKIATQIKKLIEDSKVLADAANATLDKDVKAQKLDESIAKIEEAAALEQDYRAAAKQIESEKKAAIKEVAALREREKELAARQNEETERDARAALAATRLGASDRRDALADANSRQRELAAQNKRQDDERKELQQERIEAERKLAALETDSKRIAAADFLQKAEASKADALERQTTAVKTLLSIEEARAKKIEAEKRAVSVAFDTLRTLTTSDLKDKTEAEATAVIDEAVAAYELALDGVKQTIGDAFFIDPQINKDFTDLVLLSRNQVALVATRNKGDELSRKAVADQTAAIAEQQKKLAAIVELDEKRKTAIEVATKLANTLNTVSNRQFEITDERGAETAKQINESVLEIRRVLSIISEAPGNTDEFVKNLANARNTIGKALNINPLDVTGIFGGKKEETFNAVNDLIAALVTLDGIQGRISATGSDTKTEEAKLKDLERAYNSVALVGVEAQKKLTAAANETKAATDGITQSLKDNAAYIESVNRLAPRPKAGGGLAHFAGGGMYGSDKINALLSPGEFVVNAGASRKFYSQLVAMNSGSRNYAGGGSVNTSVGDINISMHGSGNASTDVVRLGKLLRREIRRGTVRL